MLNSRPIFIAMFSSIFFSLIGVFLSCHAQPKQLIQKQKPPVFLEYQGAWFSIDYPSQYRPLPSIKSSGIGYDSVFFQSPDKTVTFYICSPQWHIKCSDIKLDQQHETLISKKNKKIADKQILLYTIQEKKHRYLRSYQDITEQGGSIHWIIGLKYKDLASLKKHHPAYLHFKKSLKQFSD